MFQSWRQLSLLKTEHIIHLKYKKKWKSHLTQSLYNQIRYLIGAVDFGYFYTNPKDGSNFLNWKLGLGVRGTLRTLMNKKPSFGFSVKKKRPKDGYPKDSP